MVFPFPDLHPDAIYRLTADSQAHGTKRERAIGRLLSSLPIALTATVVSALFGVGHLLFGETSTGVGFVLTTALGVLASTALWAHQRAK